MEYETENLIRILSETVTRYVKPAVTLKASNTFGNVYFLYQDSFLYITLRHRLFSSVDKLSSSCVIRELYLLLEKKTFSLLF